MFSSLRDQIFLINAGWHAKKTLVAVCMTYSSEHPNPYKAVVVNGYICVEEKNLCCLSEFVNALYILYWLLGSTCQFRQSFLSPEISYI